MRERAVRSPSAAVAEETSAIDELRGSPSVGVAVRPGSVAPSIVRVGPGNGIARGAVSTSDSPEVGMGIPAQDDPGGAKPVEGFAAVTVEAFDGVVRSPVGELQSEGPAQSLRFAGESEEHDPGGQGMADGLLAQVDSPVQVVEPGEAIPEPVGDVLSGEMVRPPFQASVGERSAAGAVLSGSGVESDVSASIEAPGAVVREDQRAMVAGRGVVRGFRAQRSSDLSELLGFTELVRGTRRAVRKIMNHPASDAESQTESPPPVPSEPKIPSHWMSIALRNAGAPGARELSLTPDMDADEAWRAASVSCGLSMDEIAEFVASHFRLRAVDLDSAEIERVEDIPDSLIRRYGAIPIAQGDRYVLLAVSDPSDPNLEEAFSFVARRTVALVVAPPQAIAEAIWKTYGWML